MKYNFVKFAFAAMLLVGLASCSKVPAGNVGVKVYLLGTDKGVDSEELGPGRYWIGINEDLFLFPTFTQNYVWTRSSDEGSPNDESISFQTVEGMVVNADVGISYSINPEKVNTIFQKYRKSVDEITDIYLRNMVRDALVKEGSTRRIESVYGSGKSDLMNDVEKMVRSQVDDIGINIERIYWIGELRLPDIVVERLNEKIAATQRAEQRQNEVAQTRAEAEKAIEEAKGIAESRRLNAQAEADAVRMKGEAEASAIRAKGEALRDNPQLVELIQAERWDGVLPTTMVPNGTVPFVNVK